MARPHQPPDPEKADLNQADPTQADLQQAAKRRRGVRRTALILAAVAAVIYVAFILSGVLGGAPS